MALFRRHRLFEPTSDGMFKVRLPGEVREWVAGLADEMEELVDVEDDNTRRLFPTAYVHDPELDAGYQILAREQLMDSRREAVALLRGSVGNDVVTAEELTAWMNVVNNLRLVLGTKLDISEDDQSIDFSDPDLEGRVLYQALTGLLAEIVDGMTTALPEGP